MIDNIYNKTIEYLDTVSKEERKRIGQFFTQPSIANFIHILSLFFFKLIFCMYFKYIKRFKPISSKKAELVLSLYCLLHVFHTGTFQI